MVVHQAIVVPEQDWLHHIGYVHDVSKRSQNHLQSIAWQSVCGPPNHDQIYPARHWSSLVFSPRYHFNLARNKRMKCVSGKCGRCNLGPKYICKDGPVFSLAELNDLPSDL